MQWFGKQSHSDEELEFFKQVILQKDDRIPKINSYYVYPFSYFYLYYGRNSEKLDSETIPQEKRTVHLPSFSGMEASASSIKGGLIRRARNTIHEGEQYYAVLYELEENYELVEGNKRQRTQNGYPSLLIVTKMSGNNNNNNNTQPATTQMEVNDQSPLQQLASNRIDGTVASQMVDELLFAEEIIVYDPNSNFTSSIVVQNTTAFTAKYGVCTPETIQALHTATIQKHSQDILDIQKKTEILTNEMSNLKVQVNDVSEDIKKLIPEKGITADGVFKILAAQGFAGNRSEVNKQLYALVKSNELQMDPARQPPLFYPSSVVLSKPEIAPDNFDGKLLEIIKKNPDGITVKEMQSELKAQYGMVATGQEVNRSLSTKLNKHVKRLNPNEGNPRWAPV